MDESVIDSMSDMSCLSLILVGSSPLCCHCVYDILSVCHYVIMSVLSSAHHGQCVCVVMSVSSCQFHYVIVTLSVFLCHCHYVSVIMSLCHYGLCYIMANV